MQQRPLWGQPLAADTKENFAKADQARKDFDMRNNVDSWKGPMAREEGPNDPYKCSGHISFSICEQK